MAGEFKLNNKLTIFLLTMLCIGIATGFVIVVARDYNNSKAEFSETSAPVSKQEQSAQSQTSYKEENIQPEEMLKKLHPDATIVFKGVSNDKTIFVFKQNIDSFTTIGVAVLNDKNELILKDQITSENYVNAFIKDINADNLEELIIESYAGAHMFFCDIYQISSISVHKILSVNGGNGIDINDINGDGKEEIIVRSSGGEQTIYSWDSSKKIFSPMKPAAGNTTHSNMININYPTNYLGKTITEIKQNIINWKLGPDFYITEMPGGSGIFQSFNFEKQAGDKCYMIGNSHLPNSYEWLIVRNEIAIAYGRECDKNATVWHEIPDDVLKFKPEIMTTNSPFVKIYQWKLKNITMKVNAVEVYPDEEYFKNDARFYASFLNE